MGNHASSQPDAFSTNISTNISTDILSNNTSENDLCESVYNVNATASPEFTAIKPPSVSTVQRTCKNMMLSCIDFRFVNGTSYYMNINGKCNKYDQFVLAGSSLGYNGIQGYENWTSCCNQHIELAHKLHNITEITIFDHLDCGAYKLVYTAEELAGEGEFNLHVENLNKASVTLKEKYPFLEKINKIIIDFNFNMIVIP